MLNSVVDENATHQCNVLEKILEAAVSQELLHPVTIALVGL